MGFDEFRELTVAGVLEKNVALNPDKEMVVFGEDRLTYAQVNQQANALAVSLAELGVLKGDKVALILPNWPEYIISFFAIAKLGAVMVPFSTRYRAQEVEFRLNNAEVTTLIAVANFLDVDYLDMIRELRPRLPHLQHVIIVGGPASDEVLAWDDVVNAGMGRRPPAVAIDRTEDVFAILYTLGVTGVPKGAMLTHANLVTNATDLAQILECGPRDVFLGTVPIFNAFGITPFLLSSVISQARMVLMDVYRPQVALWLIQEEGVTVHHGVPTMFTLELNHPDFSRYDLSSLRTGIMSGAPCPPDLVRRVWEEMGCDVLVAYGLTEASPGVTITRFTDGPALRAETVGRPMPGVEVRIVDDRGQELPRGEIGELICRGPNVMKGYYRLPDRTEEMLTEGGWLLTGDLATMDENDYVRIVGRKKDVINRGGFKVYPRELEDLLRTHPKVADVAVIWLPDVVLGEISCACLVLKEGQTATRDEFIAFCRERVSDFKVPDKVVFVEVLPRSRSGAVRKDYLREHIKIQGRAWKYGKNVDTDVIIPARHCTTADPKELAQHCLEDLDPDFVKKVQRGDLIVADTNFGCGSSREVAPLTIKAAGVGAVVAKSFARIFFRNAINIGLPIFECPEAVDGIETGDEVEIDPTNGVIRNLSKGTEFALHPFPDFLQKIIARGGLMSYV